MAWRQYLLLHIVLASVALIGDAQPVSSWIL